VEKKQREFELTQLKIQSITTNTAPLEPQNKALKFCLMSLEINKSLV